MNPYPERHNWWYRSPEELGTVIQVTKDCRKATMSRTTDDVLDKNPTAEVQSLGRDIGNSPSIREVSRSRSVGSSSRIRESASTLEQSPAQVAQMLLRSRQLANQQEVQPTPIGQQYLELEKALMDQKYSIDAKVIGAFRTAK